MDNRPATATDVEIDFRALVSVVARKWFYLLGFVVIVAVGVYALLSQIAPVYKSEATLLIETGGSDLTRPTQSSGADRPRSTRKRSPARCSSSGRAISPRPSPKSSI